MSFRRAKLQLSPKKNADAKVDPDTIMKLKQWQRKIKVQLPSVLGTYPKWRTYPGLFAGGKLDVMTTYLLSTVQDLVQWRKGLTVLDFCCGSGTIAATVLGWAKSRNVEGVRVGCLDADAIALHAAKKNVPGANEFFQSDCWNAVDDGVQFDLILSNPPVHMETESSFDVISSLVSGANKHLRDGGCMFIVAQNYVPVGRFLASSFTNIELISDSRFAVWKAVKVDPERPRKRQRVAED